MASLNVRLTDELEGQLKEVIAEVKKKAPRGAEVNSSTIVRGALEEFFNKLQDEKKGVQTARFNFSELKAGELQTLMDLITTLTKSLGPVDNQDKGTAKYLLSSLLIQVNLYALKAKF